MHEIVTSRLTLRLMSKEFLEACLVSETAKAEATIGLSVPIEWYQRRRLMTMRLNDCRSDPAYTPWSVRAIGLESSGEMIGHIGFHSRPDPEYLRQYGLEGIELGYSVISKYQRQGFATEAIRGLLNWATQKSVIRGFVVSIAPTNVASMTLARKLGFVKVGEHQDEVDGLEFVSVLTGEALERFLVPAP